MDSQKSDQTRTVSRPQREKHLIFQKITTLRFQVLGIVITSVLIPSFLGGWFASSRINDLLQDQVYTEIETRTLRIKEQLGDWLKDRSSLLQSPIFSWRTSGTCRET